MAIGDVPQQPQTSEVRQAEIQKSGERMQDGAEAATDAFKREEENKDAMRNGVDFSNRTKDQY